MTTSPARLFVLLARQASIGVILRRGPSDWVQMIKWHTDTDKFEEGQWLRGEIDEYFGDLSPDGRLLFYGISRQRLAQALAMQNIKTDKLLSFDAVSKPPYFTALALWEYLEVPGGNFLDNSTIQLYTYSGWHPTRTVPQLNIEIKRHEVDANGQLPDPKDVFFANQGWKRTQTGQYESGTYEPPYIWNKSSGDITLFTRYAGYISKNRQAQCGVYNQLPYLLSTNNGKIETPLRYSNWADFDQQGRLVLAKEGKLFSAALQNGDLQLTELADFNANQFESIEAPEWAQKW